MAKKLYEMTVDDPEAPVIKEEKKTQIINRTQYTFKSEAYTFLKKNVGDLITVVDHYLRTYTNPKRQPAPLGGITDRRNKRITKIHEFLKNFEKKWE
ncbi:hypothetical protein LCGC14_0371980 [marine sediment metagenome]|uniref:Uncharacterized protein n=1 Tax=marine sediment metagenome TaxID=412755 RepID=A0A0F9VSB6_9ZZZZ